MAALAEEAALDLSDQAAGGGGISQPADVGRSGVLGAELLADARAIVLLIEVIDQEEGVEFFGRLEAQGRTQKRRSERLATPPLAFAR